MADQKDLVERHDLVVAEVSEFVFEPLPKVKIKFNETTATRALAGKIFEAVALGDTFFLSAEHMPVHAAPNDRLTLLDQPDDVDTLFFRNEPYGTMVSLGPTYAEKMRQRAEWLNGHPTVSGPPVDDDT